MFNDEIFGNPIIHKGAYVSSKSTIIGKVIIEDDVIVAPNVSIRADEGSPHKICRGCNIQDGVVIHGLLGKYVNVNDEKYSVHIGTHCSITHGALIHGPAKIGKKSFIGFNSTVHSSEIGRNSYIGFNAIVKNVVLPPNTFVPDGMIVNDQIIVPTLETMTEELSNFNKEVVDYNKKLHKLYKERRRHKTKYQRFLKLLQKCKSLIINNFSKLRSKNFAA